MCGIFSSQQFTQRFVNRLSDEELRGVVPINWNVGGLHFSQKQEIISPIGPKANFISVSISHTNFIYFLLLHTSGDVCKLTPKPVKLCVKTLLTGVMLKHSNR